VLCPRAALRERASNLETRTTTVAASSGLLTCRLKPSACGVDVGPMPRGSQGASQRASFVGLVVAAGIGATVSVWRLLALDGMSVVTAASSVAVPSIAVLAWII
jgi:hypothetical protein